MATPLNRTRLELKRSWRCRWWLTTVALNRTRLELKHIKNFFSAFDTPALNRTRLELKPMNYCSGKCRQQLLIAPDWNWNIISANESGLWATLLIAPDWNWNMSKVAYIHGMPFPLNRTRLELKQHWHRVNACAAGSLNRTRLELKQIGGGIALTSLVTLNRTRLELKHVGLTTGITSPFYS